MCNVHETGNHSVFTQKTPISIALETSWDELIGDWDVRDQMVKCQMLKVWRIYGGRVLIPDEIINIANVVVGGRWLTNVSVF